jgi:hypothetical protein
MLGLVALMLYTWIFAGTSLLPSSESRREQQGREQQDRSTSLIHSLLVELLLILAEHFMLK